jgi:hypothetical protein
MRKKMIIGVMSALILGTLTSCNTKSPTPVGAAPPDPVLQKIEKNSTEIHKQLVKLSKINQQKAKDTWGEAEVVKTPKTGPLSQLVTFRWSGPLQDAVKTLADMVQYDFKVIGQKPIQERLVSIDALDKPAFNILEDLGWQAGENIGVVVDQKQRFIQIVYAGGRN